MNEQKTIEKIRGEYEEKVTTKMDSLKTLDKKVRRPAQIFAYVFGSVYALVFGTGMCLAMKVIGAELHPAIGIGVGLFGMGLCVLNYFTYKAILKSRKKKYGGKVLELCDAALEGETK